MTVTHLLECLGGTVMHALWQGLVIGILVLAALRSTPNLTARSRHAISSLGLIAFFVTALATFGSLVVTPLDIHRSAESNLESTMAPSMPWTNESPATTDPATSLTPSTTDRATLIADSSSGVVLEIAPFIAWAWLLGVTLLSLRLFRQWVEVQRLRLDHTAQPDERWIEMFEALKRRLALDSKVRMFLSRTVDSPMVVGWIRPVVLVPVSAFTSLTPDQLETILAHELLHISRRDHLLNMLQGFIEIALFFHPITWWLSRKIRIERENCCDDASLKIAGSPRSLAEALLALETLRSRNIHPGPTLAATGGSLMHRVSRLFGSNHNQALNVGWRALSACTLMAVAGLSFATIAIDSTAFAQDRGATDRKRVESDVAGDIPDDKRKARIEDRLRAMGMEIRQQVAAGEMTAEDGRAKFEAAEKRMWSRYREAEARTGQRERGDGARESRTDLEELKARIEVQIKANGDELAAMVEDGKISEADAKARFEELERRLWMRYRAAEEGGTQKGGEENRNIDLEELKAGIEERLRAMGMEIRQQVAAGEMSAEDGRAKFEAAEKRMWSRYREAEARTGQRERGDGARESRTDLEELKAGIEERLRAMGREIRQQVAAGEMSAEDGRAKFEAMEKRMWTRYRAAEEKQMKGRKETEAGNRELEELKAGIEERLRAMGGELREQVAAGEMTGDEAREKFEAMEERMWTRYRAAEEKMMKGRKETEAGNRELEELKAGIEERLRAMGGELREQVAAGEMTGDEAREKFEAMEERMWTRYRAAEEKMMKGRKETEAGNRELEELKAGIEERLRAMGGELREQVAAGEMTGDEAREKFEAMEERMWTRYRAAEEKQMKGRKEAEAGNRELEELKAGIEERLRAMGREIRQQVAAGEMSAEDGRAKFEAMEKRMWTRYRAAEEKQMKGNGEDKMGSKRKSVRRISKEDFNAAVEKMTGMVQRGEITRQDMETRLEQMKQMMKD